ncbi:MAG: hypothetical protein KDD47_21540 [Acidobacteria bacterium]|nr:hypothetical protein [Acidobacteriota bacterium]
MSTKRVIGLLSIVLALGVAAPLSAQPTRMLEEFTLGESSRVARVLFLEGEGSELCVVLGTRRGPRTVNRNTIFIGRRVRPNEKGYSGRLKFKFGNQPDDDSHPYFQIWHACAPSAGPAPEGSKEDVIELTVRGAQEDGSHARFFAQYPKDGKGWAIDIHYNNVGGLAGGSYEMPLDPDNPRSLAWEYVPPPKEDATTEAAAAGENS